MKIPTFGHIFLGKDSQNIFWKTEYEISIPGQYKNENLVRDPSNCLKKGY